MCSYISRIHLFVYFFFSFKGTDRSGNEVAIKVFQGVAEKDIEKEAEMMAKCNHKNVVKFLGLEKMTDTIYNRSVLAMELCDGNLQRMVNSNPNGFDKSEFHRVVEHLVAAIGHLHKMQIIHRDIKPGNIVVCQNGNNNVYKMADFGSARELPPNGTYGSIHHGTYEYLHPDLFVSNYHNMLKINPKRDLFSESHELWPIGATIYEIATGKPKNGRKDIKTMHTMITAKKMVTLRLSSVEKKSSGNEHYQKAAN